ncbi:MAG: AraC family transcriptional regulator [Bacteroidales bacterium]|jgi:AraC-like DNA-binding protein|nr:AraC family transcriptional regulator [Bacteroidales bacterium]
MVAELESIAYDDGGGFRASYVSESTGFWHFHPEYELVLNLSGNGTRIIGDSVELFDKFDMVLIGGNVPHTWNFYRKESPLPEKNAVEIHFRLESLGEKFLSQHEMHDVRNLLQDAERGIAFSELDARNTESHVHQMVASRGINKVIEFFNILKILCSSRHRAILCSENYKITYDEYVSQKMSDVYTYIRENYFRDIPLERISKIAKMSPFAFSRYFKKHSGAGFVEYLNRVRTNKACHLLRETNYQIHDIASECGFSSISNFNKQFRKTEGISPRDFRTQFR